MTRSSSLPNQSGSGSTVPAASVAAARLARRPYRKPELIAYGRVEDMTRAGKKSGSEPSKKPRN